MLAKFMLGGLETLTRLDRGRGGSIMYRIVWGV